jgi:hypothetical protein
MTKPNAMPDYLRRACGCMSGDGGFKAWLDARFGAGKWMVSATPPTVQQREAGIEIAIDNHDFADLAVEYGHERLVAMFGSPRTS